MSISNNYLPVKTLGNGVTTQFSASWNVINASYIRVYFEDVTTGVQTLQVSGYTMSFDESGLTVTFSTAPTSSNYVILARSVAVDQTVPYKTSQGFQGAVQENSFDKITAITQDIQESVNRSIKFPLGVNLDLSLPVPEASKIIGWNATADGIVNYTIADLSTTPVTSFGASMIGAADATAGRSILGLGTAATTSASDYATAAQGAKADTAVQPSNVCGYIGGLLISNNVSDANNDIDISIGSALSDDAALTDRVVMNLSTALVKRLDAAWAVGTNQGGLDTGAEANSTWYHVWLIKRADTGVVDVLFSLSATSPTMPANYTKKRRIGAIRNDGSGNILAFAQFGNGTERTYIWKSPTEDLDYSATTTAALKVLKVPTGIKVQPMMNILMVTASVYHYFSSPDATDVSVNGTGTPFGQLIASTANLTVQCDGRGIWTDTSGQIRSRASGTGQVKIATIGWTESL